MRLADAGERTFSVSSSVPFSFSALCYSEEQLTEKKHDYELEREDRVILSVDYKQDGIGSNSCGPELDREYAFDELESALRL